MVKDTKKLLTPKYDSLRVNRLSVFCSCLSPSPFISTFPPALSPSLLSTSSRFSQSHVFIPPPILPPVPPSLLLPHPSRRDNGVLPSTGPEATKEEEAGEDEVQAHTTPIVSPE